MRWQRLCVQVFHLYRRENRWQDFHYAREILRVWVSVSLPRFRTRRYVQMNLFAPIHNDENETKTRKDCERPSNRLLFKYPPAFFLEWSLTFCKLLISHYCRLTFNRIISLNDQNFDHYEWLSNDRSFDIWSGQPLISKLVIYGNYFVSNSTWRNVKVLQRNSCVNLSSLFL